MHLNAHDLKGDFPTTHLPVLHAGRVGQIVGLRTQSARWSAQQVRAALRKYQATAGHHQTRLWLSCAKTDGWPNLSWLSSIMPGMAAWLDP
jgi:hypothetical protein